MEKNYYLTPTEQKVYSILEPGYLITVEDIKNLFPEMSTGMIYKVLHSLNKKGYLYRIKKNLYTVQAEPDGKYPLIWDIYRTALTLFKGYIGFISALEIYNLIDYAPFTIYVVTPNKSGKVEIGLNTFRAVAMGKRATGLTLYEGIYVSNIEKTFFDCFYKPLYCGGYKLIAEALSDKLWREKNSSVYADEEPFNWDKFLEYFEKFASPSLCQRTGYILDKMREEYTDIEIPEEVIQFFKKRIKNKTKLLPTWLAKGKYCAKWKVLDNIGIYKGLWNHGY